MNFEDLIPRLDPIRKGVRRYKGQRLRKLENCSRAPKYIPRLFCLLILCISINSQGVFGKDRNIKQSKKTQAANAVGQLQSVRHISTFRDLAEITYPNIAEKTDSLPKPRTLLLIEPRHFDHDGVYIWRDPKGIWNILCSSRKPMVLSGIISGTRDFERISKSGDGVEVLQKDDDTLTISILTGLTFGTVHFKATGSYVDFDLLLNGKHDMTHIYLGVHCKNPEYIPFRIENRPITIPEKKTRAIVKIKNSTGQPEQAERETTKQSASGGTRETSKSH